MLDPQSIADFSSEIGKTREGSDLDQRLGLYRVFLKLYEHHRGLLDEILDLESNNSWSRLRMGVQYVMAFPNKEQMYLITNLVPNGSQAIAQPQNIWLIGRDRLAALPIADKRLSRRHAAIQYIATDGFYLFDLGSTNGTFINGESVRRRVRLNDGDHVRLGSLAFYFFICPQIRAAQPVDHTLLTEIAHQANRHDVESPQGEPQAAVAEGSAMVDDPDAEVNPEETLLFLAQEARNQSS